MRVDEEDLKLSKRYTNVIEKTEKLVDSNIKEYKEKYSNYIEASLFLDNRQLVKKLLFTKKDKIFYLYTYISDNFEIKGIELKLLLLKKGYLVNSIKKLTIFIITFLTSLTFNFILELGVYHLISLLISFISFLIIIFYLYAFIKYV